MLNTATGTLMSPPFRLRTHGGIVQCPLYDGAWLTTLLVQALPTLWLGLTILWNSKSQMGLDKNLPVSYFNLENHNITTRGSAL